jgi:N-acetylglucosamine-6-phosphate deacetylase
MASETPARALGLEGELGVLAVGARADLLVLAPPKLALVEVYVAGERVGA